MWYYLTLLKDYIAKGNVIMKRVIKSNTLIFDEAYSRFNGEPIHPRYTFDNFVQRDSNKYAFSMAFTVARNLSEVFNPLFIYGGISLGKTHLICAIANDIKTRMPEMDVMYITSETFVNDYVSSIKDKTQNEFREKYRNVDVLLVDDIQFLAGRDASQQEFFYAFDALHNGGRQIVLTSVKPPKDLRDFSERLVARFCQGCVVEIGSPELETRTSILERKAQNEGIEVTPGIREGIEFIAEHEQSNIRNMEGAFAKLMSYSRMENVPVTRDYACRILGDFFREKEPDLTPQQIKEMAEKLARYYPRYYQLIEQYLNLINNA